MEYLFQDGGKPKKVGRPKSKASKNDKKTKTTKSKKVIKSKKGGNFLGSVGELIAPTGWEGFATTAGLFALDRADAALRRVKKEKISKMKGGAASHNPENWVFDEEGYARIISSGSYVDYPDFNPRKTSWWSEPMGAGWDRKYAVNLRNLYTVYKDQVQEGIDGCKFIMVRRNFSTKGSKTGGYYERKFWVNEKEGKVCTSPCNCTPKKQPEMMRQPYTLVNQRTNMSPPHVREAVENANSINSNRKRRQARWEALSDAEQILLLSMWDQAEH
jgi:hypothetical protein